MYRDWNLSVKGGATAAGGDKWLIVPSFLALGQIILAQLPVTDGSRLLVKTEKVCHSASKRIQVLFHEMPVRCRG